MRNVRPSLVKARRITKSPPHNETPSSGWLGHVSIATTNRYVEIDLAMKAKALEACEVTSPGAGEAAGHRNPDILAWLESL